MGYKLSGVETGGMPMHIIKPLMEHVNIDILIETGTAGGASIKEASKLFKECHTIELIRGRAEREDIPNVKWHTGNSIDILPKILSDLPKGYKLFWLDAHYSDPVPNTSKYKECYILEELEIISRIQDEAIIIIDDARHFYGHPPYPNDPRDWASIQDIFVLLRNGFPHNYSTITDDYIISLPDSLRLPIDTEWRARYSVRYPSAEDKLKVEVKNVYNALQKYIE